MHSALAMLASSWPAVVSERLMLAYGGNRTQTKQLDCLRLIASSLKALTVGHTEMHVLTTITM